MCSYKYYGSKVYTAHVSWDEDFDPEDPAQEPPEQQYLAEESNR